MTAKTKAENPCDGAVQAGHADGLCAVWRKDGKLFTVAHDAAGNAFTFPATDVDVICKYDHEIPWK